jgi:nickel-dependent lactate racemase
VPGRFDVVVSSNAGYPLDRNLYQAVKGMAAAERVVTRGGVIVLAAECRDGLPEEGAFARLVEKATSVEDLVHPTGPPVQDGWQAQVLGRVLGQAGVQLYTSGLDADQVRSAQLEPVSDVSEAVARAARAGAGARVCVLPLGPLTVATPA